MRLPLARLKYLFYFVLLVKFLTFFRYGNV